VLTLLSSGVRWVAPATPAELGLVSVEGSVGGAGRGCTLPPTPGLVVPMLDPD
jgi:hypothetical protein